MYVCHISELFATVSAMTERPVSAFSRSFALHLRGVMAERNIKQQAVAALLDKSKGYVSEHTSGKRPVDSDLLDAVAEVGNMESHDLIAEIARRMSTNVPLRGHAETTAETIDRTERERRAEMDDAERTSAKRA
jgi:transcriptional regulator with XRE-family HTH domain